MSYDPEAQDPTPLNLYDPYPTPSPPTRVLIPTKHASKILSPAPPIIKSSPGNLFWADENCVRHIGLTPLEASLFLQLQSGNYDHHYSEYANMFHAFGEEKRYLEGGLRGLEWWKVERRRRWEDRVEWLGRLEEPRLWLLFLMARRRRIRWVACRRVLGRLREKREERRMREPERNGETDGETEVEEQRFSMVETVACPMVSKGSQTPGDLGIGCTPSHPVVSLDAQTLHLIPPRTGTGTGSTSDTNSHLSPFRPNPYTQIDKPSTPPHPQNTHRCPVFPSPRSIPATPSSIAHLTSLLLLPPTPYLILGYFPTSTLDPHEHYLPLSTPSTLFPSLHHAEHNIRGSRRSFSLKSLSGFGIYKCDVERGAHVKVALGDEEKMVLRRFFIAYRDGRCGCGGRGRGCGRGWRLMFGKRGWDEDVGRAWMGWVGRNLNADGEGNSRGGSLGV